VTPRFGRHLNGIARKLKHGTSVATTQVSPDLEGSVMRETHITLPELGLIAITRVALGAGLALLLGERLTADERKTLGWALAIAGAITTVPLAAEVIGKSHPVPDHWWSEMEMTHAHS
jgi:hypothetical protein